MQIEEFYASDGPERCGFILRDGTVVEVQNVCAEPENGFEFSGSDIFSHLETARATWHTHPGAPANLSMADFRAFLNFPQWEHLIVGADGILRFFMNEEGLLCSSEQ